MEYVVLGFVIIAIVLLAMNLSKKKAKPQEVEEEKIIKEVPKVLPYASKLLLTKNEWFFYKNLKPIADKYNLHPIAKIRLADIVEVKTADRKEKQSYFNRIKSKHIDFALCNPENLRVLLLIELDDNSHDTEKRKQRDEFVEAVLDKCGYKLIRTRGTATLEDEILKTIPEHIKTTALTQ